jgi:hypothetical protein
VIGQGRNLDGCHLGGQRPIGRKQNRFTAR